MPRQPRQHSESGYLHLIVRGIGKQLLFEEREDSHFFLSLLRRYSAETSVSVLAYCLMENHVHLLVRDEQGQTPLLMKKLGVSYSSYLTGNMNAADICFRIGTEARTWRMKRIFCVCSATS